MGLALLVATTAKPANAQAAPASPSTLEQRKATFAWDQNGRLLRVSYSYRDVIDGEASRKLQSGLPTVIVMRGYLFPVDRPDTPVALTVQSCRIAFDVWNEVYRLQISQPGGETSSVAVNIEGVLRRCAEARALPLVDKSVLAVGGSYFLSAIVEVNPISREMLERIRGWVSRPPGSTAITPGDSLFGSFVGLFVARIGEADRTLSFRTQSFVVPN
jgi:hypothetical protein